MNKKLLFTSLLSLSLLVSGCGKKNEKTVASSGTNSQIQSNVNNEDLSLDNDIDQSKDTPVKVDKEKLKGLMDDSDYITRVKVQVDAENKTANNFIEDYKGDLSNVEITLPKTLTPSKEYIIFYKDGPDGKIVPTNPEDSFIEITGSDDGNLNFIESYYLNDYNSNLSSSSGPKAVKHTKDSKDTDSKSKDSKSSKESDSKSKDSKSSKESDSKSKDSKSSKESDSKSKDSKSSKESDSKSKEHKSSKESDSKSKDSKSSKESDSKSKEYKSSKESDSKSKDSKSSKETDSKSKDSKSKNSKDSSSN